MASSSAVLMRLMASAFSVAEKAGDVVRSVLKAGDLDVVAKTGANDLQTKADRLAQQSICASLARKFPRITIIGEEDLPSQEVEEELIEGRHSEEVLAQPCPPEYSSAREEELVVWVDPLDGTKEYTEGLLDHVTVLIGVAYEGRAIGGVINQPFYNYEMGPGAVLGRTIWGVLGLGAFGFDLCEVPAGQHIVTTTRSHSNKLVTDCVDAMQPHKVIRVGGAGNKVSGQYEPPTSLTGTGSGAQTASHRFLCPLQIIQLIEGKASAYVFASPGCKKWDTCAPEAILHAVGGKLADIHGNSYTYHRDVQHMNAAGVLATLRDFDYYASRVPVSVKLALSAA
uniref:3'(2'),5'-bisphosphate nucleotidase 1 n=1 Tax=Erpetoichthys calabaricus TaxID=27687 RepID=A0A8C4RG83_ERPCA